MNTFSASACVRFAWQTFKSRPWFFVGVTAVMIVLSWIIGAVAGMFGDEGGAALIGFIVNTALGALLSMGYASTMLRSHDAPGSAQITDLWFPKPFLLFLFTQIVMSLIIVIGFILLIVPGIIAILTLLFAPYVVVDKQPAGWLTPIKESARITKGHKWELLVLILMAVGINILGAIALLVGLLVSIPVTTMALVHAYRDLAAKAGSAAPAPAA